MQGEEEEKEARKSYEDLETKSNQVRNVLLDPRRFVNCEIEQLKYFVRVRKSELEKKINFESSRLLEMLDELKSHCDSQLVVAATTTNTNTNTNAIDDNGNNSRLQQQSSSSTLATNDKQFKTLDDMNRSLKFKLDRWYTLLNARNKSSSASLSSSSASPATATTMTSSSSLTPAELRAIRDESDAERRRLNVEFDNLKERLFLGKMSFVRDQVAAFQAADLNFDFETTK